ncbi:MAG: alpha/beta fold hydrolase [Leptolyngbyaceae cyanobacterium SM1_1_3]|nr:alpha/beta fold hydrolase [Leptolyngbyaceae cyanobacterium SM1_1_3]NJN01689.1 alpha/beta fold hydrolase [Leptolyngbyaceae cyanobacterium RM1_1_2]
MTSTPPNPVLDSPQTKIWQWQTFAICYQQAGTEGAPVVLIHGFGASSHHWRKNIAVLAQSHRVYAIDLIGFGGSAKPTPNQPIAYTFETWGEQVLSFCREVIGQPAFLVGNSIGCIVALQAAAIAPEQILGVAMLDCSLRLLHDRKRQTLPWYRSVSAPILQKVLAYRALGHFFFARLARPQVIHQILEQAYGRTEAVTDELVDYLIQPAADPGAADVFLAFIRYSQGPLPEDLLPQVTCPVLSVWGEADPWEPVELGRQLSEFPAVEEFITLPGVGHCPQDEAPELVNPILLEWLEKHSKSSHEKAL